MSSRGSPTARTCVYAALLGTSALAALACASAAHSSTPVRGAVGGSGGATIAASFAPDRLGARGALTVTIDLLAGAAGDPMPLRRSVLRLPAGLGVQIPRLRSCAPQRLRLLGARGCPARSRLGIGHALTQAPLGSSVLTESVSLWVFLGPLRNLQPTFEVLAQGYTPFDERVVLSGTVLPDEPPYGEDLVLSVPAIPTLPLEPEASIVSMSLTIGSSRSSLREPNRTIEPARCPAGGFPFAAQFTYADGSTQDASSLLHCPR
ncbi:MAG TPA: hypothetical protein VIJ33_06405 [Solirubrobacteraceae bacterium]